ncbi:MAG: methyltransferase [Desulfurococcaceae archaeon]
MTKCIVINKKYAECVMNVLKKKRLLNTEYKVLRIDEQVLIPVQENLEDEVRDAVKLCTTDDLKFTECNPPRRKTSNSVSIPSFDIVDNVVIIRENVLRTWSIGELVENIRKVHPRVRAIWVKRETVDVYRIPVLELLWGEDIRDLMVKEYGFKFKVKLGKVFFNPRLAEEHRRLAKLVKPGEIVLDMFSGIGGFSIHIAGEVPSLVIANDLNPDAYELLLENIVLNKRRIKGVIVPLNMNSRELPGVVREGSVDRIIADIPGYSLNFVDEYRVLLKPGGKLHLYILAESVQVAMQSSLSKLKNWFLESCLEVLEYSPKLSVYRCDLVKPKYE